ncbi:MAG: hypothetical protein KGL39_46360 [Patescibacteria group bacterium]|nr:hypothetical protein [Patescibacteria group bacterium]
MKTSAPVKPGINGWCGRPVGADMTVAGRPFHTLARGGGNIHTTRARRLGSARPSRFPAEETPTHHRGALRRLRTSTPPDSTLTLKKGIAAASCPTTTAASPAAPSQNRSHQTSPAPKPPTGAGIFMSKNQTCEYLVCGDDGQRECGEPATQRINSARTLFYCDLHADAVRDNYRRIGRSIDIVPIRRD